MDIYDVKHVIIVEKAWGASEMRSEVMWQDFCRCQGLATDTPYEALVLVGRVVPWQILWLSWS